MRIIATLMRSAAEPWIGEFAAIRSRLFAALDLPVPVRDALAGFGHAAADDDFALRAVRDDALHVTLAFLGERPESEQGALAAAVERAVAASPWPERLAVGGVLWLAPRRPHVLTVAVEDPEGALAGLQARLVTALAEAVGHEPERRRFRPHVTVARVRRGSAPARLALELRAVPRRFGAEAVTLMRSHLGGSRPARYEALRRLTAGEVG